MSYFTSSFAVTAIGLVLGGFVGYYYTGSWNGIWNAVFVAAVLAVLEVSISFDNAVVNAAVIKDMTPLWQKRFMTWGMLIAVFGMRLVFPLLIVGVSAQVNPIEALKMAALEPERYAQMMLAVHHEVAAFGGTFLLLVSLKYFMDHEKDLHWIPVLEKPLAKLGKFPFVEVFVSLLVIAVLVKTVDAAEKWPVLISSILGIVIYLMVEGLGHWLQPSKDRPLDPHKASLGLFIYLEVLDASFSFDGVIGAFAITNNLFIIAIGLGIGAMFVRSITLFMVEKKTLGTFRYLEHGAFWAVVSLACIMYLNTLMDVPEVITAGLGVSIIALSVWSSIRHSRQQT